MGIVERIRSWFSGKENGPGESFDPENFVYVRIPGHIEPLERGELFEDRIDPVLAQDDLGFVSGGGSSLSEPLPDGTRVIEYCGIDIDVTDRDRALAALRALLPQLDAPSGTELHYTRAATRLRDVLAPDGWQTGLPRDCLHPGFDV